MIFNDGLPFKGFMDIEHPDDDFRSYGNRDLWDLQASQLGGGSNSSVQQQSQVNNEDENVVLIKKSEITELKEINQNLRIRHLEIITRMNSIIDFLGIESKVSNNLIIEFLQSVINDSVDEKEIKTKINKLKNPVERRLDNIED